ncbi:MAG TPA: hypothetical protein VLL04_15640 [Rhizomicrobium sp.]|nr:hypothetical protein [Rhizomicrobium sp.]
MQHFSRIGVILAVFCWPAIPAVAASFHPAVIRPAASATARSSASQMSARANAHASDAAGNPYVNPRVPAGRHGAQTSASADANAAVIRSSHQSVTAP